MNGELNVAAGLTVETFVFRQSFFDFQFVGRDTDPLAPFDLIPSFNLLDNALV